MLVVSRTRLRFHKMDLLGNIHSLLEKNVRRRSESDGAFPLTAATISAIVNVHHSRQWRTRNQTRGRLGHVLQVAGVLAAAGKNGLILVAQHAQNEVGHTELGAVVFNDVLGQEETFDAVALLVHECVTRLTHAVESGAIQVAVLICRLEGRIDEVIVDSDALAAADDKRHPLMC